MTTTFFPNGVSDAAENTFENVSGLPVPDPFRLNKMEDDFHFFNGVTSDKWFPDNTGAASGSSPAAGVGGFVELQTDAAANDRAQLRGGGDEAAGPFEFSESSNWWFKCRFQPITPLTAAIHVIGLCDTADVRITDGVTNGVFFRITNGALSFVITRATVEVVSLSMGTVDGLVEELAFHYDPVEQQFNIYLGDQLVLTQSATNSVNSPVGDLTLCMGVETTEAVAKRLDVDFIGMYDDSPRD